MVRAMESESVIPGVYNTLFAAESMYKYLQTHIEALKRCINKSTYKQLLLQTNDGTFCYLSSRNTFAMM